MLGVALGDEVREYGPEALRYDLWVWDVTPRYIVFGQAFVPPHVLEYAGPGLFVLPVERAALFGDAASRETIYGKLGRAAKALSRSRRSVGC